MGRIEAVRRMFGQCVFDQEKTAGGVDALGWYHEKRDAVRQIGLGPEHDWASHGADAFGMACIVAERKFKTVGGLGGAPLVYGSQGALA